MIGPGTIKFYWAPMSTATITEVVLLELGLEHERIELDIDRGDTRQAGFLAINPNGRVPVIVHGEAVIWESAAITIYLGETFGVAKGLFPEPGADRAHAMKWIVWTNTVLGEAAGRLSAALPETAPGAVQAGSVDHMEHDPARAEAASRAHADLHAHLEILDGALCEGAYLLGDDYSLVDAHAVVLVAWVQMMGVELTGQPNLEAWMVQCLYRPAIAQVLG